MRGAPSFSNPTMAIKGSSGADAVVSNGASNCNGDFIVINGSANKALTPNDFVLG
jgi:hypothetical protein